MDNCKIVPINEDVYLLNDQYGCTGYVIVGSTRALVIDTMIGWVNIEEVVRSITDKPYDVVNTHGHSDHIGGNIYVKEAYISPDDLDMANADLNELLERPEVKEAGLKAPEWKMLYPGTIFDLGDRTLEVYPIAGHTKGCMCLLDRKDRILFTGDGIISHLWMQLKESLTFEEYHQNLLNLKGIRGEYDMILTGHCQAPEPTVMYDSIIRGVEEILEGKTENDIPHKWNEGMSKAHLYDPEHPEWRIVHN